MRPKIAYNAMPFLWTPGVAGDACELANAHARRETHFVIKVLLDDGVCSAKLPGLVLILHCQSAGEILAGSSRSHRFHNETVESHRLAKSEVGIRSDAAIVKWRIVHLLVRHHQPDIGVRKNVPADAPHKEIRRLGRTESALLNI